ncbi:putative reverse transcriptase domain-containing protein [Tanacetum coccineum]
MLRSSSSYTAHNASESGHIASLSKQPTMDSEEDPLEHEVSSGRSASIHSPTPTSASVPSPPTHRGIADHPGYPIGPRQDISRYPRMATGVPVSHKSGMTLEELSKMQYLCAEITRAIYTADEAIVIGKRTWYLGLSAVILVLALVLMVALMNRPNPALAIEETRTGGIMTQTRGRAFIMGANEACQNPNIVTGTFSLNNHYATALFDSGADYSFISTKFMPLIDVTPSILNPSYEIEVANGQIVETNKIVHKCNLVLEGRSFSIDLIPFGHGSFDVIVGMNWKVEVPYKYENNRAKLEDIPIARDFPEIFPKDLSGLPLFDKLNFA